MTNDKKKARTIDIPLFKSEKERRDHLAEQEQIARERGFTSYAEHQKNLAKEKLNKLTQDLETSVESCSTALPYNVNVVIHRLNSGLHKEDIDADTYHTMLESVRSSAEKFERSCDCSGSTYAPIREKHSEEIMNRFKLLKESVESCRTDAPSMSFMANKSLGAYAGYVHNGPSRLSNDIMELLDIAVEFKGCSCKRKDRRD